MNALDYFIPAEMRPHLGSLRAFFEPFLTSERIAKINKIASQRSRHIIGIFEATYHCHNISAVLRTMEAFGYQDSIFVYETLPKIKVKDTVERGAAEWLTLRATNSIEKCAQTLKQAGYQLLLVSLPDFENSSKYYESSLPNFTTEDLISKNFWQSLNDQKIALVFGNEALGISSQWRPYADGYVSIAMYGFIESLNLSVSAGIILNALKIGARKFTTEDAILANTDEKDLLIDLWATKSISIAKKLVHEKAPDLAPYLKFILEGQFFRPF